MEQEPLMVDGGPRNDAGAAGPQPPAQGAEEVERQNRQAQANAYDNWQNLQESSPRIFYAWLVLMIVEVIATTVILTQNWDRPCDRKLREWIASFTGRFVLTIPFTVYRYVNRNQADSTAIMQCVKQFGQVVSLYMFAWWIVGQVWVFGSENCRATAPPLWNYSLILIILMYVWIFAPLILIALLCVCMPCVLVVMRIFAEPKGATKEVIESLPTIKFDKTAAKAEARQDESIYACSVCMEDYKEGETLLVLPCKHQFHKRCIRGWLPISKTCPACRADIVKEPDRDDENP